MAQTVLIVDDHEGFRRFARRLLEADGLTVIGEAADGASAIAAAAELDPDLVLLDVMLPDGDGFAVAERIAQPVVLTSSHAQDDLTTLDRHPPKGPVALPLCPFSVHRPASTVRAHAGTRAMESTI